MAKKKTVRLTKKTARELIERELGIRISRAPDEETAINGVYIYEYIVGNCVICVQNDWLDGGGKIHFSVTISGRTIDLFFFADTLEEDFETEEEYHESSKREMCAYCPHRKE